jgi:hypothetical protein
MGGGSKVHDSGRYEIVYIDSVGDMAVLGTSPVSAPGLPKWALQQVGSYCNTEWDNSISE